MSNPFKYGQIWVKDERKIKILGVCGDVIFTSNANVNDLDSLDNVPIHYLKPINKGWKLEQPKKWECLTADNWKARRDKPVFAYTVNDSEGAIRLCKLQGISEETGLFLLTEHNSIETACWSNRVSIHNDEGVEAKWEVEE